MPNNVGSEQDKLGRAKSGIDQSGHDKSERDKSEQAKPGVSREQRISDEGLARLEKQLRTGVKISRMVLDQWVKRYGDGAKKIIDQYKR